MEFSSRRQFLQVVGAGSAAVAASPWLQGCAFEQDPTSVATARRAASDSTVSKMFSKYFAVEVKGMYGEVPGVVEVDAGRVTVDVQECTQGDKPDYRTYTYGSHEYEDLTLTVAVGPGSVMLQNWADKAMKMGGQGDALRRDISIHLLARDKKTVLQSIHCFGCIPIDLSAGDHGTGSDIKTITLTCEIDRVEIA